MTTVARTEMTLHADIVEISEGTPGPVAIHFAYLAADPLAVYLTFHDAGVNIRWSFGRDLLREALERTIAGYGDVRFAHHGTNILMNFNVPSGYATYAIDRGDVRAFIRATERLVPFGSEVIDVDAGLALLLTGGER